jgi:hypothetical protein
VHDPLHVLQGRDVVSAGLPGTAIKSASDASAISPRSGVAHRSAALIVAVRIASAGDMPSET